MAPSLAQTKPQILFLNDGDQTNLDLNVESFAGPVVAAAPTRRRSTSRSRWWFVWRTRRSTPMAWFAASRSSRRASRAHGHFGLHRAVRERHPNRRGRGYLHVAVQHLRSVVRAGGGAADGDRYEPTGRVAAAGVLTRALSPSSSSSSGSDSGGPSTTAPKPN